MTIQPQNNNLNYLIDPTFMNVNRLFVLSFQRIAGANNTTKDFRDSFSHYYVPNARIKDFNVLIDGQSFFDLPVKNEEEAYEKIIDMSNNNDYTMEAQKIVNLLDDIDNENSKFPTKKGMLLTVDQKEIIQTKMKSNF